MKAFDSFYARSEEVVRSAVSQSEIDPTLRKFVAEYGGTFYDEGIYRVFDSESVRSWTKRIREHFASESSEVQAFGRDWQGNIFGYRPGASPCVCLFQPGTGEVYEVAESLESFHNSELTEHAEEALSLSLWKEWLLRSSPPSVVQCVAYKQPIFLGGAVTAGNLTLMDMDVYWEVMGQLLAQVRGLPDGTAIETVVLSYLR